MFKRLFAGSNIEQSTGEAGEAFAAKILKGKGYRILAQNWRCSIGELDIVATAGGCLIVVEVKSSEIRGRIPPEARVNTRKQHKLRQLALAYQKSTRTAMAVRFDVIAVWGKSNLEYEHIENAFS